MAINISDAIHSARQFGSKRNINSLSERMIEASQLDAINALALLESSHAGLTEDEVSARREQYGLNEVAHEKPPVWYIQFLHAFLTPFNGILLFIGCISVFTDIIFAAAGGRSYKTLAVLTTMIMLSTVIRFWQEFRSSQAAEQLKAMVRNTTAVLRDGFDGPKEILVSELVPGDIIYLAAGDMIPSDIRIISSKDLFISQAMLTGESLPVEKFNTQYTTEQKITNPLERSNLCFMGTNVVSGSGIAVAVTTGDHTYFGSMASDLTGARPLTSFDKGINHVSWILIRFIFVMVPIVFLINGFDKGDWLQALLFAVSVAVGLTPEMLPMIVTANLARGAVAMSKHKVVIKRLNAIQNFGAMDILCTDKTGTLTQDKIILERHIDIHGNEDLKTLQYAWLNSSHQTGLKNLLDVAVLTFSKIHNVTEDLHAYRKIDEIPFDFKRRRMSVIVRKNEKEQILICKGAVEEVFERCSKADENGNTVSINDKIRKRMKAVTRKLSEDGMRILAIAYKNLPVEDRTYTVDDENDLTLVGYIAFLDPPKEGAREAIAALGAYGIDVKIITGDNEIVTRKICSEVGLTIESIMLGSEVEELSDAELSVKAETTTIFAKMSPMQKSRVIRILQSNGHTVGYLGDGINDASALKDADVGISVDTAVDIAKESADIILLERNLMVLQEGVAEGRRTFCNIIKYIKMTASSNFGNVFSVLIASAFLPFLPMLAIHLLIQNLLYDISQISIPWDRVDDDYLKKPRKWETNGLIRFMVFFGPISSVFDIATFSLMWFYFEANNAHVQSLFQSGWFIEGLLSQTLVVHMIRTEKIPFFQSMPAVPVVMLTTTIMLIGVAFPFTAFAQHIGLQPLPFMYFPWLFIILLAYCVLIQLVKRLYIRRFKQWL